MRHLSRTPFRAALLAASLGSATLLSPTAQAADSTDVLQYQQDVAHCHNTPGIDVQACLNEAAAAAQATRQNMLTQPSAQSAMTHRTQRCDNLPADQRQDCMTLMNHPDTRIQGSVQSGGTLRETTIEIPAAPATPADPAASLAPATTAPIH